MTLPPVDMGAVEQVAIGCEAMGWEWSARTVRNLALALTAAEKQRDEWKLMACNIHLSEDKDSLYSSGNDAAWIANRDRLIQETGK